MRRLILPICLMLGACMPGSPGDVTSRAAMPELGTMPAARTFPVPRPTAPQRANAEIVRDFMDLSMKLESGRELPVLTRFETPITVQVTGAPPPTLQSDLSRLLHRLRSEAGIDIRQVSGPANITIETVSRADIRRELPQAACFVVPNISRLSEYRSAKRSRLTAWSGLQTRRKAAVFIPNDTSPQEVRDCLHEELAQALGPLNDLYRLPDSVFNDDNVHTVLTGFDMLILRAYYAPELHSGMSRRAVAARLPTLIARLNPAGERIAPQPVPDTPRAWIRAIQSALGPGTGNAQRRLAAEKALSIAKTIGWTDHRRAFSHYAMGRIVQSTDPALAQTHFAAADAYYRRSAATVLHRAHSSAQLAAYAINQGRGAEALALLDPQIPVAERHENAALLAQLLMMRAEALELSGRVAEARTVRMDSLGWARYGYGADWAVRAKLREVSALSPLKGRNG
ncbi:ATP-dependent transcriptional regulator [Pelagivirga sediminicola]|uniref:ATP-dependent transcriptional regulator n=1 Tax=Pelagivirga sediminicola TaxID=2170575 RepID=A0A2T7G4B5_9RHOB|nr:DUF2927 domain-containing protein [Pelagivirga sediminicola]PVA09261.1 ATP-dependent transcriptional regulator [Pelagivirga sediminicola]